MRVSLDIPTDAISYAFSHDVRVRFAETDAMGVAHHSSYIAWLEVARVEFLRSLGTPYPEIRAQGVDLAVLELFMNYRVSARFDDLVTVHTRVSKLKGATFQMDSCFASRIRSVLWAQLSTEFSTLKVVPLACPPGFESYSKGRKAQSLKTGFRPSARAATDSSQFFVVRRT